MRLVALTTALGLVFGAALPAAANFDVKAKGTCYGSAEDTTKVEKDKGNNDDIVAGCLGVSPSDPSVADYSLVFDSDTRTLQVIRNCDSLPICQLSEPLSCATAEKSTSSGYKLNQQCVYGLIDFGENSVQGSMLCKESESYNESKDKFSFKTSCNGTLDVNGAPCTLKFSSKKLFEESGSCPAP